MQKLIFAGKLLTSTKSTLLGLLNQLFLTDIVRSCYCTKFRNHKVFTSRINNSKGKRKFFVKVTQLQYTWDKVFKNGPNKICGRQPLKILKWYGLLRQTISLQIFLRLSSTNFAWSILENFVSYMRQDQISFSRVFCDHWKVSTFSIFVPRMLWNMLEKELISKRFICFI